MLQPTLHMVSDQTVINNDPTMEPHIASLACEMDEEPEDIATDRPTSIHIHDRLIDKEEYDPENAKAKILNLCPTCDTCNNEQLLNVCQQCNLPLQDYNETLEETLNNFHIATKIEDSIYTQ